MYTAIHARICTEASKHHLPDPAAFVKKIEALYGLPPFQSISGKYKPWQRKDVDVYAIRQVCALMLSESHQHYPLKTIAFHLGFADHTGPVYAIKRARGLIETHNPRFTHIYDRIFSHLQGIEPHT